MKSKARAEAKVVQPNLMGDIRASIANVPVHLPHDANVLVTIQ